MTDAWPGQALTADPDANRGSYGSGGVEDDGTALSTADRNAYGSGGVEDQGRFPGKPVQSDEMSGLPDGSVPTTYDPDTGEVTGYRTPDGKEHLLVNIHADPATDPTRGNPQAQTVGEGIEGGVRNILEAGGDLLDVATSPIVAPLRALGVDLNPVPYKERADQLADALGLSHVDGVSGAIQRGLASGVLTAGAAGPLASLPGTAGAAATALAETPLLQSAASGASAGAGEAAREGGSGELGQAAASLAGGAGVAGFGVGGAKVVDRVFHSDAPSELLQAFQRQMVTPMADQIGGTGSRMASAISRMTLGGIPLAKAAEKSIATAEAARDRIAGTIGRVADDTGAGQAAQRGARHFVAASEAKAGKLYDAIPIARSRLSTLTNTRDALYDLTRGMESNPELSRLVAENPRLKGFLDALTPKDEMVDRYLPGGGKGQPFIASKGGELSWEDLKRFRSIIGEIAGQPSLAEDTSQAGIRKLYGALSQDMRATAAADGPRSLAAFERANTFWRARQTRIDDTLSSVLGNDYKKSAEAAFATVQRWSREGGDSASIARLIRSLPDDEANTVRATIFARMGNAPARGQGEAAVFSPTAFVKQWGKLDARAKGVLFPGAEYRQSLEDIAKIAGAMERSGEFANTSRTALAGNGIGLVTMALAGNPVSAGGIAGTQLTLGHLLAHPKFAKWLASSVKKPNPAANLAHINRLTAIATAEPVIANEVLQLQQRLASAFTDAPMKAVASDNENRK